MKYISFKKITLVILFLIITFSVLFSSSSRAFAEQQIIYSEILADLSRDSSFNLNDYPENSNDNSLQVITVAENVDKNLIVYVYQPSGQSKSLVASSINISKNSDMAVGINNYKLKLLNSDGTLFKYLVKNFVLSSESTRYYSIVSIYRPFDKELGDKEVDGNVVNEIAYNVSEQWKFVVTGDNLEITSEKLTSITVTDMFVGFVRYENGWQFFNDNKKCDSHFVAFNTSMNINELYEAEVDYFLQSYDYGKTGIAEQPYLKFGKITSRHVMVTYKDDKVVFKGNGWNAPTYKWDTIQTMDEFVKSVNVSKNVYSGALLDVSVASKITKENEARLKDKKWVLRFDTTSFNCGSYTAGGIITAHTEEYNKGSMVGEFTIFRLKFKSAGKVYNLGVVDNKQTGSLTPANSSEWTVTLTNRGRKLWKVIKIILIIVLCAVAFFLLAPVLPYIFKGILIPFKLIFKVIKKIARKDE